MPSPVSHHRVGSAPTLEGVAGGADDNRLAVNARPSAPLLQTSAVAGLLRSTTHHKPHDPYQRHTIFDVFDSKHRGMSASSQPMIQPAEYEALPLSVQKKYFSSAERLRIAQAAAAQKRKRRQGTQKKSTERLSSTVSLPDTSQISRSTPPIPPPPAPPPPSKSPIPAISTEKHHRKPSLPSAPAQQTSETSVDKAIWFLGLPEKAKRQQFSEGERAKLTRSCKDVLRSYAAAQVAERKQLAAQSLEASKGAERPLSRSATTSGKHESRDADDSSLRSTGDSKMNFLRMLFRRQSLTSKEPPLAEETAATLQQPAYFPRDTTFRSIRSNLCLRPLAIPPPRLRPEPYGLPSPATLDYIAHLNLPRASFTPPQLAAADAMYIQDPTAREKLRQLTAPQRFDEAIEFGFSPKQARELSSSAGDGSSGSEGTTHHLRNQSINDSSVSEADSLESQGPETPVDSVDHSWDPSVATLPAGSDVSVSSMQKIPTPVESAADRRPSTSGGPEREMTLRITLTRPELRASATELYGWQLKHCPPYPSPTSPTSPTSLQSYSSSQEPVSDDPLSLQKLPVCDDASGSQGAFAVREADHAKSMKVLKSLRRR